MHKEVLKVCKNIVLKQNMSVKSQLQPLKLNAERDVKVKP